MASVFDINPEILIKRTSEEFMKEVNMKKPEWANFVKTSVARERMPVDPNWWYLRAASVLRKLYILDKPIGTNKLKGFYGGRKNRGHKPDRRYDGSGKIIRVILQQLERADYVKSLDKGVYKGRVITPKGKKLLDGLAKK